MAPLYSDRDYLDSKFRHQDVLLDEIRGDIKELRGDVKEVNDAITGNRIELAKAGGLSAFLIAAVEVLKRQVGQ